mmetsp:Transcript_54409/g.172882  ORF Transcript_54409/g.172882 Transcript_54409/m.172882 type:complete len:201 (+) Transcript_54409:767-1369(+)
MATLPISSSFPSLSMSSSYRITSSLSRSVSNTSRSKFSSYDGLRLLSQVELLTPNLEEDPPTTCRSTKGSEVPTVELFMRPSAPCSFTLSRPLIGFSRPPSARMSKLIMLGYTRPKLGSPILPYTNCFSAMLTAASTPGMASRSGPPRTRTQRSVTGSSMKLMDTPPRHGMMSTSGPRVTRQSPFTWMSETSTWKCRPLA